MKNNFTHPSRKHPIHSPNIERFNQPIIIFLTVCTFQHKSILASEIMHKFIVEAWENATHWLVGRYMIMPDHIHLFCSPAIEGYESIVHWTAYWKRKISIMVPQLRPIWQKDCWDTQLRNQAKYEEKWQYIVNNPVRKNLVVRPEDWPFQGDLHELRW